MKSVLIDTNILFSALINPQGRCSQLVQNLIIYPNWKPIVSSEIYIEFYALKDKSYLTSRYPAGILIENLDHLVNSIPVVDPIKVSQTSLDKKETQATDKKDQHVLVAFKAAAADYILTGNTKDFPDESYVITPAQLWQMMG